MNADISENWDESFETAKPLYVGPAQSANGHHREPTGPITDPERHVLGCCLLDEGATLDVAIKSGLTSADFYAPANAVIYLALYQMRQAGTPIALDTLSEQLGPRLQEVGGIANLMALDDPIAIGTTTRAGHYVKTILKESAKRRRITAAQRVLENPEGEEAAPATIIPGVIKTTAQRKPSDFLLTPDDDASVLLGNRFLNRGDGGILVGSSGMGKSSASIQMSVSWALGLPFMGIKSNGCLRILIIQSEDSDGDIAEVMLSMRHMLKLTEEQIAQVDSNVRIVCDRVNRGDAFLMALRAHIKEFSPDLVIINPLQAFIDGDVTESRDLGKFLRGGLNGCNDNKFGYLLVHHTTKPSTGRDKTERQWHEVMYDMAGGAELINWARFVISLRAAKTNTVGEFDLVLAKRGRRAGVTEVTGTVPFTKEEVVTTIPVKHAQGSIDVPGRRKPVSVIFWEPRQKSEEEKPQKPNTGAPEKFPFSQYLSVFPVHQSNGLPFSQLYSALLSNGHIPRGSFANVLKRWEGDDHIERLAPEGQPARYRRLV